MTINYNSFISTEQLFKMVLQNWLIHNTGHCESLIITEEQFSEQPYRLYRFLTEVEDILTSILDDRGRVEAICPKVRRLLNDSPWLQAYYLEPPVEQGWSVLMLYEEPGFDLTVQIVAWLPGQISPIHNHGTWGIVALLAGKEKNTIWRRSPDADFPDRIESVETQILVPGDIIAFTSGAIHQVAPQGNEPTITFNLYGETKFDQRFEFDPGTHTARNF